MGYGLDLVRVEWSGSMVKGRRRQLAKEKRFLEDLGFGLFVDSVSCERNWECTAEAEDSVFLWFWLRFCEIGLVDM